MEATEHRDIYIAAGVGGIVLILILLYVFGGQAGQTVATNAAGLPLPLVTATPPAAQTPYNYNIQPFVPDNFALPSVTINSPNTNTNNGGNVNTINSSGINSSGGCDGCSKRCGPYSGNDTNNCTVAQYEALLGTGAG